MVDNKNDAIIDKYFDIVQEEIKRLISNDKEIKKDEVDIFNDEIFNQPDDMKAQIKQYIENATENNFDVNKVAKTLYDKFKTQVKNNIFNQKDQQNVPNQLMGERKYIKSFEVFLSETYKPRKKCIFDKDQEEYEIGREYGEKGVYLGIRNSSIRNCAVKYHYFIDNLGKENKEYISDSVDKINLNDKK